MDDLNKEQESSIPEELKKKEFGGIRKGNLNVILSCDFCLFHYHFFKNKTYSINFAKSVDRQLETFTINNPNFEKWNDELRIQNFRITVDNTESFVDEVNIRKFLKCMTFVVRTFYNEEMRQLEQKLTENLLHELNCYTHETLHKFIIKKASRYLDNNGAIIPTDKVFNYSVKEFKIKLLDETGPFLGLEIFNLEGVHCSHVKNHESLILKIKNFQILNLMTDHPDEKMILRCFKNSDSQDFCNFMMTMEKFIVQGKIHENKWRIFNNIESNLGTLVVRFSLDVFEKIYDFVWLNKIDNPLFQDANDRKLDSELAESFFWDPNNFLKKKQEIALRKKKNFEEKNKNSAQVSSIPNVFQRFAINKTKLYLTYKSGFRPIVNLKEFE